MYFRLTTLLSSVCYLLFVIWDLSRYLLCFIVLVLSITPVIAQKEASQYFYWKDSGIKFNSQGIEAHTTNNVSHVDISRTFSPVLCDTEGDLLMYTNMETIYDRTGQIMENGDGLFGNKNGYQGAVWVDLPSSRGRYYYLFYTDSKGSLLPSFPRDSIVSYALIDMQGNGGLGRVVQKNIPLHGSSNGYIAAVRHQNDLDTWVITYHFHRKEFMAYLVSSCGITGPIISKDDKNKDTTLGSTQIPLFRFSPQGDMFARLHLTEPNGGGLSVLGLWDFDNVNGMLKYKYGIDVGAINYFFSPLGNYIYTCNWPFQGLTQYDVHEPDSVTCFNNRYNLSPTLDSNLTNYPGVIASEYAAHLYGQDGKIYLPMIPGIPAVWLARINYPDLKGAAAQLDTIDKNSKIPYNMLIHDHMYSYYRPGYHTPVYNIGEPTIAKLYICAGVSGIFLPQGPLSGDSCVWKFGDGTQASLSGNLNASVNHTYKQSGNYNIGLIRYFNCASDTARQVLTVSPTPYLSPLPDTLYYCGEPIKLELTGGVDQNYLWSTGSNSDNITVTSPGIYSVTATQACGTMKDSTYIKDMGLEIPNLVTQNGDGKNDSFEIVKVGNDQASMQIYNSWGSQVYSNDTYLNNWPDDKTEAGLYYYHYSVFNCNRKGWVQVMK
jgi:hypothetical protein